MNRRLIITVMLCIAVSPGIIQPVVSGYVPQPKHTGKWEGTDNTGETAAIKFEKDGYAVLYKAGEVLGEKRDQEPLVKYEFDYSKTPIWLDLIVCDLQGNERGRMKSIVKFLAEDQMLWRLGKDESTRPTGFDYEDKENTVLLKKVSQSKPQLFLR